MKRDVDTLLRERGLSAALIIKGEIPNFTFRYLVGPPAAHLSTGILVWKPGQKPHLVHGVMERDSAAATGFERSDFGSHRFRQMLEDEGSRDGAMARLLAKVLNDMEVRGPVLVHGTADVGRYYHVLNRLRSMAPQIEIAQDEDLGLFELARATKDPEEIEAVRGVAAVCSRAYERIRALIGGGKLEGTKLKDREGWVTVGRLRREVRRVFFEANLEEPHGNIIAMGRDAGVPHNEGNDADVLEEGRPIVIDLYPAQSGGGYYFDVTRTFCVGRAPAELKEMHGVVREAVERTMDSLSSEAPARMYQEKVCDFFESKGHKTIRQDERLEEGYIHGLGHGIGLEVHERPNLGGTSQNKDRLSPGSLFTVEPGLYYPSRQIGIRIEDVVYARPDGTFENLTPVPYDLEVAPASS
ncbi:MAG TPA: Xaa-Pro peptidase family protein [Candidatus Eisenbacteria bacterium]|jgi:Xaa-Pro aminopeptidase|nr:Xaa-Pro peptidase family protein [Candidatus Eisenbacteria bacterium]